MNFKEFSQLAKSGGGEEAVAENNICSASVCFSICHCGRFISVLFHMSLWALYKCAFPYVIVGVL